MRCVSRIGVCALTSSDVNAAVIRRPLCVWQRHVSIAGGGRGDLFKRHAGQYKAPYAGAARGITNTSESTEPQDGQLYIRKKREHVAFDRMYSGGGHNRAAIATWSYLVPSLRKNVAAACPDALYEKLMAGEEALTLIEEQQLADAQRLFRFELQQRIGLLEDSLAEAELQYLLQWPSLFQRAWLRLPISHSKPTENVSEKSRTAVFCLALSSLTTSPTSSALTTHLPTSVAVWASSSAPAVVSSDARCTSFAARLELLTRHVVDCVEADLRQRETSPPAREDGAARSRRQEALEATWRLQWQSAVCWHAGKPV
jgi:hypothetical protein